jgi:hypothetical protein
LPDGGLDPLGGLPRLARLTVSDPEDLNFLTQLRDFKQLRVLSLSGSGVTDDAVAHLRPLKQLDELLLGDCKISATALEQLRDALPGTVIHDNR